MNAELIVGMLAKSSVIAGAALVLSVVLTGRPAVERVDVLRAGVCILLGLPLIMAIAPDLQVALLPASSVETSMPAAPSWQGAVGPVAGLSLSGAIRTPSLLDFMAVAWAIGAVVVFGRFILGVLTLRRWTGSGRPVTDPAWTAPLERFALRRRPRLIASTAVEAPLSWGFAPGVVLIGETCIGKPQTAAAVLAHELAHIRRGDWLFLALSRLALALFWFNPLVWLLHATLAARTEDAADAAAIIAVDRRTYARALVGLAADFRHPAAIGMAGDAQSLTRRIARIMDTSRTVRPRPLAMALAIGALAIVATPIAALEITRQSPPAPPAPPQAPRALPAPPAPPPLPSLLAMPAPLPPLPPLPPLAPPEPPAPPALPRLQDASGITITEGGRTRVFRSVEDMDPETRRAYEQAREEAAAARAQAAEAREQARAARAEGARARAESRIHRAVAMEEARAATAGAQAAAAEARVHASAAQEEARHATARARVEMRKGADEMRRGANEMREEGRRLRDPAYRARQIEENRARGATVTDAELVALSRRLPEQADEMDRQAERMRAQSDDRT